MKNNILNKGKDPEQTDALRCVKFSKNRRFVALRGQSVIQSILTIAIIITSSIVVINMITPTMEEGRSFQEFDRAKQMMSVIDSLIRELAVEASGATRSVQISSDFGSFIVAGRENRIRFTYDSKVPIMEPGTSQLEGNMVISGGSAMSAYESDINGDGTLDLVLENDALLFAIRKIGSSSSYAALNTTNIITRIQNKQAGNINITSPRTKIYVGNNESTTYGTGYTELTRAGGTLTESSIRVFVNSTEGAQYEAVFILSATKDFVELEIQNIVD